MKLRAEIKKMALTLYLGESDLVSFIFQKKSLFFSSFVNFVISCLAYLIEFDNIWP